MPFVQVTAPNGALSKKTQDELMSRLSVAVIKAEGAQGNDPAALALVWAYYNEIDQGASYVGGQSIENAPIVVEYGTPQDALTDETRDALVAETGIIFDEVFASQENKPNHWALLREIDEGGWGGGGQIYGLAVIQEAMNISVGV